MLLVQLPSAPLPPMTPPGPTTQLRLTPVGRACGYLHTTAPQLPLSGCVRKEEVGGEEGRREDGEKGGMRDT